VNTCATCRNWARDESPTAKLAEARWGLCVWLTGWRGEKTCPVKWRTGALATREDFGCVCWEEKR
jgi:hypothetical protein